MKDVKNGHRLAQKIAAVVFCLIIVLSMSSNAMFADEESLYEMAIP